MRRRIRIETTDGFVGKVDKFVVNPESSHLTHLVMREGNLWIKKDVIIPVLATSVIRQTWEVHTEVLFAHTPFSFTETP